MSAQGSNEAIHTLLTSVAPEVGQHPGKLTPDALRKLSEKIGELVGEDAVKGFNQARNERGELVNEEGLPIIDITEPIAAAAEHGNGNVLLAEEDRLTPISDHPPSVRERWRKERDRILDLLEEEENMEQVRKEQINEEQRQEILRKRREAAAQEKAKLNAAKGMQKKLGKALLRSMAESGGKGEDNPQKMLTDQEKNKDTTKKTVAFADPPDEESDGDAIKPSTSETRDEWGDVTPARLRSTPGPSLLSSQKRPIKMTVVERHPPGQTLRLPSTITNEPDSDDESELGSPDDLDQADPRQSPVDHDDKVPPDSDEDENVVLEEEDFDFDFAQHQRQIALQYHEKRTKIAEVATAAMMNHSHSDDDDGRADIPLDMPSSEQQRPSISRFKANRIAASYNASTPSASSTSTSLGASVLPASSTRTLQRAIRTGKLDADERLVGGDADSASEEENEGMQEVLELLKKGEVYNLGPDGNYIHTIPPRTSSNGKPSSTSATSLATANSSQPNSLPPLNRPKTSKFKLSRSQLDKPTPAVVIPPSPILSSQDHTPVSHDARSSPKLPTAMTSSVIERLPLTTNVTVRSPSSSVTATPTAIDSPSGLLPTPIPTSTATSSTSSQVFSMVIDSPSFLKPKTRGSTATSASSPSSLTTSRPSAPAVVASAIRDPSAQDRSASSVTTTPPIVITSPSFPPPSARPSKPPTVMSTTVKESKNQGKGSTEDTSPKQERKVSRFMAERM